jgi:GNAT superfamily N-acetyltransferase
MEPSVIECRTMSGPERYDAYTLMRQFRGDEAALGDALGLFVERPDYGFIWLAYADGIPVACVSVAFGISTESGGVSAELDDLWVVPERRRQGIGSALIVTLQARLDKLEVTRIDAQAPHGSATLRAFFEARGYADRGETTTFSLDRR